MDVQFSKYSRNIFRYKALVNLSHTVTANAFSKQQGSLKWSHLPNSLHNLLIYCFGISAISKQSHSRYITEFFEWELRTGKCVIAFIWMDVLSIRLIEDSENLTYSQYLFRGSLCVAIIYQHPLPSIWRNVKARVLMHEKWAYMSHDCMRK